MTRPAAALLAIALAACTGSTVTADTAPPATPAPVTTVATVDSYQQWLVMKPVDAPDLSPDEAQARALLGCGTTWAAGTTDAVLAEAYAPLIEGWRAQGMCG